MANQSEDDDDGESEADFYQPLGGLSPSNNKNGANATSNPRNGGTRNSKGGLAVQQSDTKFFQHLQSHRQEQRQSFSPPFKNLGMKTKDIIEQAERQEQEHEEVKIVSSKFEAQNAAAMIEVEDEQEVKMGKSAFEEKCDVLLQVQRAEIFQDSLDELPQHLNQLLDDQESAKKQQNGADGADDPTSSSQNKTTKVVNEDG